MPSTDDLTRQMLPTAPHPRNPEYGAWREINKYPVCLLETARDLVLEYPHINRSRQSESYPTYEEIYSILKQVEDANFQYYNPALGPMIKELRKRVMSVLPEYRDRSVFDFHLTNTIMSMQRHIVENLKKMPTNLERLGFITAALKDQDVRIKGCFTTNYDLVIDKLLRCAGCEYVDGFEQRLDDNLLRRWNPEILYGETDHPVLLKLHGGVNWHYFRVYKRVSEGFYAGLGHDNSFYAISERAEFGIQGCDSFDGSDGLHYSAPLNPRILIGTVDKMLDYNAPIFSDVFGAFGLILRKIDTLIVSGYGFGDMGVNDRVIEWLYSASNNRIVIIHPDPNKLKEDSHFLYSEWDALIRKSRFLPIPNRIEKAEWHNIKESLGG